MHIPNSPSELIGSSLSQLLAGVDTTGMSPAVKAYHVLIANMLSSKDYIELLRITIEYMRSIYAEMSEAPDFETHGLEVASMVRGSIEVLNRMAADAAQLETLHSIGQ
jgi:hypothetical protein